MTDAEQIHQLIQEIKESQREHLMRLLDRPMPKKRRTAIERELARG